MPFSPLEIRRSATTDYADIFTPAAIAALHAVASLDDDRQAVMRGRVARRAARAASGERIAFLDPSSVIARTAIRVEDARAGRFTGSAIPRDLQRQWIQGTGPAARPRATLEQSLRNVAYALLSGSWTRCRSTTSAT
jgi:malate synthase